MAWTDFRFNVRDVLAVVLVVAGLAVLGTALWFRWDVASAEAEAPDGRSVSALGETLDQPVDVEALLTAPGFRFPLQPQTHPLAPVVSAGLEARVLALFILHAKVCPPCLDEVSEYVELLEMESWTGETTFQSVALVIDDDDARAERFVMTTPLPLAVGHGPPESLGALRDHLGERQRFQQLVFIDLDRGVLFYRTWMRNILTPAELKQSVLDEMRSAHRRVAG
ncbi:MAG: hypothetical protein AAGD38_14270 [Acidobacteriota bacterium]